jgi:hypothetical protein
MKIRLQRKFTAGRFAVVGHFVAREGKIRARELLADYFCV